MLCRADDKRVARTSVQALPAPVGVARPGLTFRASPVRSVCGCVCVRVCVRVCACVSVRVCARVCVL